VLGRSDAGISRRLLPDACDHDSRSQVTVCNSGEFPCRIFLLSTKQLRSLRVYCRIRRSFRLRMTVKPQGGKDGRSKIKKNDSLKDDSSLPPRTKTTAAWSAPNAEEDRKLRKVRRILENPAYRRADQDLDLLKRDELRPTRLELEFLKANSFWKNTGSGERSWYSAEPASSNLPPQAKVERRGKPWPNTQDPRSLSIAWKWPSGSSKSHYYDVARELGRITVRPEWSGDCRLVIITGGGPGLWKPPIGERTMRERIRGIEYFLAQEQFPNPYITPSSVFSSLFWSA